MSTKCTIAHGDSFHFYNEVLDDDHVHLELETDQFEAGHGRVRVAIPIHIWETIRPLGGARLDLVDKEDDELLAVVEERVDERTAAYQQALRESPDRAEFVGFFGCLLYGKADSPREDQIRRGMEHARQTRLRQREVKARIAALRGSSPDSWTPDVLSTDPI